MFVSRKELKRRLEQAESDLFAERTATRRSAIIESAALPQCKSLACVNCEHIVYASAPYGNYYVVGCGKNNPCSDYKKKAEHIPLTIKRQALQEALQSQSEPQGGSYEY